MNKHTNDDYAVHIKQGYLHLL